MKNKWEVKSHSYQIADTGDYDGWHELTNGVISLGSKDDDDETVEVLQALASHLNAWDIDLFDHTAEDIAIDNHLLKEEIKIKEQEWKSKYDELKAENERLQIELEKKQKDSKQWCNKTMEAAQWRIKLQAENERLKESSILFCNKYSESQTAYAELVDEAQRLVDALKWYADDGNYFGDNEELATAWKKNMAKKANTALQDWQNKEGV